MLKPFVADVMGREVRQYLLGSLQCAWQCSGGVILAVAWQCGGVLLAVWVIVRFFVQMFTQSSLAPILFLVSGYEPPLTLHPPCSFSYHPCPLSTIIVAVTRSCSRLNSRPSVNMDDLRTLLQGLQGSAVPSTSLTKLSNANYVHWKREMTMYLKDAGLWDVVTTRPGADPDPAWRRLNNRALLAIFKCCEASQQDLIEEEATAYAAWLKFQQTYQARDAASIQRIYNEFTSLRKERAESVMHFIARVKSLAKQLTTAGEVVSPTILFNRILMGLGSEYESVKAALALVDDLTEAKLTSALLGAEARLSSVPSHSLRDRSRDRRPRSRSRSRSPDRRRSRSRLECRTCGRSGHSAATCWNTFPELRDQARFTDQRRPPATGANAWPPYVHTASFADAMTSLGWKKESSPQSLPSSVPSSSSSSSLPYPTPSPADSSNMWDVYDLGMVLQLVDDYAHTFRRYVDPMAIDGAGSTLDHNNCFSIAPSTPVIPGMWLIDRGASNHYTSLRHILSDFKPIPRVKIITGKGYVTAVGIGNVTLHTSVGLRTVFDVMWVPELTGPHHLLSIPQLISKRCDIRMSIGGASIYNKDGILLVEGIFTGKGFLIKMAACIRDVSSLPAVGRTS